jgi:hypothetical protein
MLSKDTKVKSLSVETQSDISYHQEVTEQILVRNLICIPEQEEIEDRDGFFQIWILCRFNLNQVEIVSDSSIEREPKKVSNEHLSAIASRNFKENDPLAISKSTKVINILSIPQCTDLLISGARPRSIKCENSPIQVPIVHGDVSIKVRAPGRIPKTININARSKGGQRETIQVILEAN